MAKRATTGRKETSSQHKELVLRRCPICDWQAEAVEQGPTDLVCPVCHAPTDRTLIGPVLSPPSASDKNPHAAALGRLGGLKGGRARAEVLTAARRRAIARKAANARWHKSGKKD